MTTATTQFKARSESLGRCFDSPRTRIEWDKGFGRQYGFLIAIAADGSEVEVMSSSDPSELLRVAKELRYEGSHGVKRIAPGHWPYLI